VTRYVVVLEVRRHGSSFGTTEDVIEAADAAEAEAQAVAAWKNARHECSYAPLLTLVGERSSWAAPAQGLKDPNGAAR
jgi:hypothetical protein